MATEFGPRQESKETKVFALAGQTVEIALRSIREDPQEMLRKEGIKIHNQNLELELYLIDSSWEMRKDTYMYTTMKEGALYTHTILRTNAEEKRERLPRLSQGQMHAMREDSARRIVDEKKSLDDDLARGWEVASGVNPMLTEAIQEMAAYRSMKEGFYAGAGLVIESFKKHEEIEIFKRQFRT